MDEARGEFLGDAKQCALVQDLFFWRIFQGDEKEFHRTPYCDDKRGRARPQDLAQLAAVEMCKR